MRLELLDMLDNASRTVVYVEDDQDMLDLVSFALSRKGFKVIGAMSGQQGLELIERLQPDLVLLDLMMPDIDGWEVYQRVKANAVLNRIPVIVVTAKAQSIDKMVGLHIAKVDDYVTKPFSPAELLQSVERVLSKRG